MPHPKVAIIYPTYHGSESYTDITRCFKTIQQLDYPIEQLEIICPENPSPHGASWPFIEKEWMPIAGTTQFPRLTINKNEIDSGYSGANNIGVRIAIDHGCDYAFLLNQDSDVDPGMIREAVRRAEEDSSIGFVQSLVLLGQDKHRVNSIGNRYHFLGYGYTGGYLWTRQQAETFFEQERKTNSDLEVPTFSGAAALVRLSMVKDIGLFDTPFYMYHEDVDATFNARIHGWKVVIEPKSIMYHYYAFSRSIKKFYWMERNRILVMLSYYKLGTWFLIFPFFCGVELLSLLFAFKSGWWREKLRSWAFYLHADSWKWVWQRRRRIQQERKISDRELLKRAEGKILFQQGDPNDPNSTNITKDINSDLVTRVANPLLSSIWNVLYTLIRW